VKIDFEKGGGLVPAIIQHADTLQVLMLGYMNAESVEKTKKTGLVTFYSRSRQTLWTKGETSGNLLNLVSLDVDCDNDTILIKARPEYLEELVQNRKHGNPDESYTSKLLQGPLHRMAQKVGEEGVETALAAVAESDEKLISEAGDLLYHLTVLLAAKNISLSDVIKELQSRHK